MAGQEPATKLRQEYSAEYKIALGKRVLAGENVKALAKETGHSEGMLYNWKYFAKDGIDPRTKRGHDAGRKPRVKAVNVKAPARAEVKARKSNGAARAGVYFENDREPTVFTASDGDSVLSSSVISQLAEAMRSHAFVIELRRLMAKHNM